GHHGDRPVHERVDAAVVAEGPRGVEGVRAAGAPAQGAGVEAAVVGGRRVVGRVGVRPGDRVPGVDGDPAGVEGEALDAHAARRGRARDRRRGRGHVRRRGWRRGGRGGRWRRGGRGGRWRRGGRGRGRRPWRVRV